jgi:transcriptional regulator with XRE-family HTH domain
MPRPRTRAWSLQQASERMGLSDNSIQRLLTGRQYPTLETMRRIEETLGWPLMDQIALIPRADQPYNHLYAMGLEKALDEDLGTG